MGYNKIPLALGFNDTTGNASGLVEFVLNLSDVGDVCTNAPVSASVLAYETDTSNWCPSTIVFPTGGGGSFGCGDLATCDLSALRNVCNNTASLNQVLALNSSNQFCPSTVVFPIPVTSVQSKTGDVALTLDEINAAGNTSVGGTGTVTVNTNTTIHGTTGDLTVGNGTLQTGISGTTNPGTLTVNGDTKFTVAGSTGDLKVGNVTYIRGADGDIEAGKDVVIGANSFTQTNAKIANVEERSLVITDSASSLSSVSGVSGSVVYFSGDTASPKLAGIPTIMEEAEVRVEDKVLKDISDVGYTTAAAGTVLTRIGSQWKAMTPAAFQQFNSGDTDSASYGPVALFDHGNGLSGLGDDDHPQYVLSGGSRAMSALTVTNGITANSLSATTIDFDPEGSLAINATNITATNLSGTGSVSAATIKAGTSVSAESVTGVALNATNLTATNVTGTTITAANVNATTQVSGESIRGVTNRWTNATGTNATITNLNTTDVTATTLVGPDDGLAITANTLGAAVSVSSASVLGTSVSAENISVAASATIDNLDVLRTGQMNPTVYIQESDWLTPGAAAGGFGSTNSGGGSGFGQHYGNTLMSTTHNAIGAYEVRSGTDSYGRAFLTTFNNALAVSTCGISFTSRLTLSGAYIPGVEDGKACFGIRNGTSNAEAGYAMEFQTGAATGQGGTTWSAVVTDNGYPSNSTVSDTGVGASALAFQVLQVSCNEDWNEVDFYIDGTKVAEFNHGDHNMPDNIYNRLGCGWAIRNANAWSTSNNVTGNQIIVDWHQLRLNHKNTTRGKDLIQ